MARTNTLLASVHKKISPIADDLLKVLQAFDQEGSGVLSKHDLLAGCAAMGVVLSQKELEELMPLLRTDAAGQVDYRGFVDIFREILQ